MAQGDKTTMLRVVLVIFAVVSLVYGVVFLIVPGVWENMSGGDPFDYSWVRWAGGFLVALAVGAVIIARKIENQGVFAFVLALATLLGGLGTVYSMIAGEYSGYFDFIAVAAGLMLVMSGLLWWSLIRAKEGL